MNFFHATNSPKLNASSQEKAAQTIAEDAMPPVLKEYCTGCGTCSLICPTDVFSRELNHKVPKVLYPDECWHCDSCVLDCPVEKGGQKAIELRVPLQLQLLWIDPGVEKQSHYDIIGDHLGTHPDTDWEMPRE